MKVGVVTSDLPFSPGGARLMAEWLHGKLQARGHQVETISIPYTDELAFILPQFNTLRLIELDDGFDRVITLRPPAHLVRHRCKVVWFIHHLRAFYDLWDTPYNPFPDTLQNRALRDAIRQIDTAALGEARHVFTNSRVVADRLLRFNGVASSVLYPPIATPDLFRAEAYGNEIVCICRIEEHKRQELLVDALRHTTTAVRLRLCGVGFTEDYARRLQAKAERYGIQDRVVIENRWISETEKAERLAGALASAYVPFDEDSYGFPTIEAAHASRCTVTVTDSGGVPEFVVDGVTGVITPPDPRSLAVAFDRLFADRDHARRLGQGAAAKIAELGIDWDRAIDALLA